MALAPDSGDVLEGFEVLVDVAENVWLPLQRARREDDADHRESERHRARRRARLLVLSTKHERIAEVDARIALLEITPGVPNRDACIAKLSRLRKALVDDARG